MREEILKAIPVYLSTMLKFIFGPLGGYAAKLSLITTIIATLAGMMTVVLLFAYFGSFIRDKIMDRFFKNRKKFSKKSRRFVTIWKKYGITGVAVLTPILLTPIGGSILAVSFGAPRDKLILYMFISGAFWAVVFSVGVYYFGNELFPNYLE